MEHFNLKEIKSKFYDTLRGFCHDDWENMLNPILFLIILAYFVLVIVYSNIIISFLISVLREW